MPFNIYADTLPQSEIVGVTYNKIDETVSYLNGSGTWVYVYEIEVLLKNKYVGVVDGTLSYSYSEQPSGQTITTSKRTYVNGDSFKLNVSITQFGSSYSGSAPMYSASFLVNDQNTNVTKYEDLTSIDSIVSILQDIYINSGDIENLSTNQLAELEKIVQNTSLANEYLEDISKLRQFNIPFESFSYVNYMFKNYESKYVDLVSDKYFNYPVFKLYAGDSIFKAYPSIGTKYRIIFYVDKNLPDDNINQFKNVFNVPDSIIVESVKSLGYDIYFSSYTLVNVVVSYNQFVNDYISLKSDSRMFIPIFVGRASYNNYSTDFALRFGLSNQMLDDLHIIAQGTQASNQQSSDLSSGTDSMQQQMNDLVGVEDSYNQQFNNSVNSIDFNNPLQQNQGLLGASNFVITVFNGLIANNPFSILIIIVCILLIGKKVIGK